MLACLKPEGLNHKSLARCCCRCHAPYFVFELSSFTIITDPATIDSKRFRVLRQPRVSKPSASLDFPDLASLVGCLRVQALRRRKRHAIRNRFSRVNQPPQFTFLVSPLKCQRRSRDLLVFRHVAISLVFVFVSASSLIFASRLFQIKILCLGDF